MRVQKISIVGSISVLCTLLLLSPDGVNKNVLPATNVLDSVVCKDIYRAMNEIRFMENRGQYPAEVLYSARLANGNVFFCRDSVIFHLRFRTKDNPTSTKVHVVNTAGFSRKRMHEPDAMDSSESHVITIRYTGSQRGSAPKGLSERTERVNIFEGSDPSSWIRDISTFDTLLYKEIYPGIDLYFFDGGNQLKYEFRVQPFHSYQDIEVQYSGIDSLCVNSSGDAVAMIGSQSFIEKAPVVFQETESGKHFCDASFTRSDHNNLSYQINNYKESHALIIDPVFSTYFGGSLSDGFSGIFKSEDGVIYLYGNTYSSDFPVTPNSYQNSFTGDYKGFIIAFQEESWRILFSTFFGGNKRDGITNMEINNCGNIIIAGNTTSTDLPLSEHAIQKKLAGYQDCFIAMLDSTCSSLLYSTYIGGEDFETLFDLTTDVVGDIYLTGLTDSRNFPRTVGAYQTQYGGGEDDVFVTKLSADGTRYLFSTFLGGNSYDEAYCIRVDSSCNIYVVGLTSSYNFPVSADAIQKENKWSDEGFIAIFDSSGTILKYSTYFGGSSADLIETVIFDNEGNLIFNGKTMSTDLPVTPDAFQPTKSGPESFSSDFFIAKYSPFQNRLLWCTYLGGTLSEQSWSSTALISDHILIAGETKSLDYPLVSPMQSENNGKVDIVLSILESNARHLLFSTYFGGNDWDHMNDVLIAKSYLYFVGFTQSSNYPISTLSIQDSLKGNSDGILTIIDLNKVITNVGREHVEAYPRKFFISNYPNPFSSSGTTISYEIATASPVSLSVFNSAGQMIHKREWPRLAVGKHVYQYHGNGIPPGVYFYTLQIGKEQTTRKMVKVE